MKPEQADRSQSRLFPCVPPCRTLPAAAVVFFLISTRNRIKGCHTSAVSFYTINLSRLFFQIKLSLTNRITVFGNKSQHVKNSKFSFLQRLESRKLYAAQHL